MNGPEDPPVEVGSAIHMGAMRATVVALVADNTTAVIEYRNHDGITSVAYLVDLATMRDIDGDQWAVVPPPKVEWVNVFADGTSGDAKSTYEAAVDYCAYDKVRIGIIERAVDPLTRKVLSAKVHPTTPLLRTFNNYHGVNPYA